MEYLGTSDGALHEAERESVEMERVERGGVGPKD